jgi:hypothetical protein
MANQKFYGCGCVNLHNHWYLLINYRRLIILLLPVIPFNDHLIAELMTLTLVMLRGIALIYVILLFFQKLTTSQQINKTQFYSAN